MPERKVHITVIVTQKPDDVKTSETISSFLRVGDTMIKQDWNYQIRSNSDRRSGVSEIRSCNHQNLAFSSGPEGVKMMSNALLMFSHFKNPSKLWLDSDKELIGHIIVG